MFDELKQIQDKSQYECLVGAYQIGHSELKILVRNRTSAFRDLFYIVLVDVRYFSGPFKWIGVNFKLGSVQECWEKLVRAKVILDDPSLREKSRMRLYRVDLEDSAVEVIASNAYIIREDSK